jgi:hypothetical protein
MTIIKLIILASLLFITTFSDADVIKIASLPYTITTSGNYELTGNLTANGTDGIDVKASNVVINLNGFSISQSSSGNNYGVLDTSYSNVVVENGTISGFAIGIIFGAVTQSPTGNCAAQNLRVLGPQLMLISGNDCLVENCIFIGTGVDAQWAGITINKAVNCQVQDCTISQLTIGVVGSPEGVQTNSNAFIHNYIASCGTGLQLWKNDCYQGNVATNCTTAFTGGNAVGTENGGY